MRAGRLAKRITLQALAQGKDAYGGNTKAWANVATVWAGVRNLSGNERPATAHGGQMAEARTEFTTRYRAGVTAAMRVSYAGNLYNIKHVNDVNEEHRMLVLTCDTGVNDG
jgi:SPP1 family predicted phage head-tail adaptor